MATLTVVAGNGQRGEAGSELSIPLQVILTDSLGRALAGRPVTFGTPDGGAFDPPAPISDASGLATALWTLGDLPHGERFAEARAGNAPPAVFQATAVPALPLGVVRPVAFSTFDGSGQVVHPDAVRVPKGWAPGRRYLAITPYFRGDAKLEFPSVFDASDFTSWTIPPNGHNPVIGPMPGYSSDPDVVFEPDRKELWLYYRVVNGDNTILLIRSSDGAQWTEPRKVLTAPNHRLISPAIVRVGTGNWHMWTVVASPNGCADALTTVEHRISPDGLTWSAPSVVGLGDADHVPWHLDVSWMPSLGQYWAVYNVKVPGNCNTAALYFATSLDGTTWTTQPAPLLERGAIPQFKDIVYRSSIEYAPESDIVTVWFSGAAFADDGWNWSAAVERLPRAELFRVVSRAYGLRTNRPSSAPPLLQAP